MKLMKIHILLFHPEKGNEWKTDIVIPMPNHMADKLLDAQRRGIFVFEQTALCNLAGAVAFLNGLRGTFIRIEEVKP